MQDCVEAGLDHVLHAGLCGSGTGSVNAGRGQESRTDIGCRTVQSGTDFCGSVTSVYTIFHTLEWGKIQTCQTHIEKRLTCMTKSVKRNTAT